MQDVSSCAQQQEQNHHDAQDRNKVVEHLLLPAVFDTSIASDLTRSEASVITRMRARFFENENTSSSTAAQPQLQEDAHCAGSTKKMVMRLCTMESLSPEDERCCPISMDEFDKASVPSLKDMSTECLISGRPDLCIGKLPCGHRFHAVSIIYHMAMNGMKCPVCRCVCVFYVVVISFVEHQWHSHNICFFFML